MVEILTLLSAAVARIAHKRDTPKTKARFTLTITTSFSPASSAYGPQITHFTNVIFNHTEVVKNKVLKYHISLAHKSNFAGDVIITTAERMRFPRPGIFQSGIEPITG